MMQPIEMLERIAEILARVPDKIVFTGGATIALYLEEVAVPDIRPTDDVDCVVEITSRGKYYQLLERLRKLGLEENSEPGTPLCRWRYQGINLDIMPCDESVLGFTNRWYAPGIAKAEVCQLPSGREIQIFPSSYLLASKIEAFIGRGGGNFYYSADIEDIVALLDGCPSLLTEIESAEGEVKEFLTSWFAANQEILAEVAPAFLSSAARNAGRGGMIRKLLANLAGRK